MDIEMGKIKNEDIKIKIPLKTRCYQFWFIKNPSCFLWVWLLSVLIISIIISEYYKN